MLKTVDSRTLCKKQYILLFIGNSDSINNWVCEHTDESENFGKKGSMGNGKTLPDCVS